MEDSTKMEIVIKKANDHWAFLEHIEAPMWADLEFEANNCGEDTSDEWFNTSHPFHQWSARMLKSKFSHPGEEILTSEVVDSPRLPSSVSRSRGKHYNSKKWGGLNLNTLLDKQQGLSKRCFQVGSSFGQEMKPLSGKFGLSFERNARVNSKSMASCSNSVSKSSSVDNKSGESNTRSTITSENTQQRRKYKEVSSQPCDQKNRSLSGRSIGLRTSCITNKALRVRQLPKYMDVSSQPYDQKSGDQKSGSSSVGSGSLGKSCVTGKVEVHQKSGSSSVGSGSLGKSWVTEKPSRVQIGGDSMQSRGRKSSSGNSSVGSSSIPGYEAKFASKHPREEIKDGDDVVTMNLANKNKWKAANVSQTSTVLPEGAKSSNKNGNSVNFAKPAYNRTAKSLAQYPSTRSRALLPSKVNKENSCTGAKEKLVKVNSLTGKGKENAVKNVTLNPKCTERGFPDRGKLKTHQTTERSRLQKGDTARSAALTKLGKHHNQCECEAKNPANRAQRIHLRAQ